ncbi:hypothetical protein [Sutcliffiella horikoshii]|uniref:hypothetical protein n=1 Tax=Sutcliffiella horikoshii TaxID=79883 RepID=UPI001F295004|nr:hypothetical protein [Sutcliffiella horikoshii]MCG1021570.1 hypothetical protein [Sutcliffiella horikoshii]
MKKKIFIVTFVFLLGFGFGAVSISTANANSNVVLASVEWVLSKINPVEQRLSQLEARVNELGSGNPTPSNPIQDVSSVVTTKQTAIRRGAGTQYASLVDVPANTVVTYHSTYTNPSNGEQWFIVRLSDNRLGAVIGSDSQISVTPIQTGFQNVVFNNPAPIRRGASDSYSIYTTAAVGSTMKYESTFVNSSTGEKWYLVKMNDGRVGAVRSNFAEVIR